MSADGGEEDTTEKVEGDRGPDVPSVQDPTLAKGPPLLRQVEVEPDLELIEFLERALDHAKTGELRAATVTFSWLGGDLSCGWYMDRPWEQIPRHALELERLKMKMMLCNPSWRRELLDMMER